MDALTLIILTLAATRATRIVTTDTIGRPLRVWITRRTGADSAITYLVHCPWCLGWWVALPVAIIAWHTTTLPNHTGPWWIMIPALWAASAYLIGRIITSEGGAR